MEYKYLLEERANKNIIMEDNKNIIYILCYHIEDQHKYPFLQFMMEKVPFCNGLIKEELTLPYLFINDQAKDIEHSVIETVKSKLININCDYTKVTNDMYKGILLDDNTDISYALVNITGIDIYGLKLSRNISPWFVLTSEIINTKMVCNIPINEEVVDFFTFYKFIGCLTNTTTNNIYILPDSVYTGGELKIVEFNSVFGNRKSKVYKNCGEYYYFYRTFDDTLKEGYTIVDNNSVSIEQNCKYINGCINRYAVFIEGELWFEKGIEFSLSDDTIDKLYPDPTIIICYTNEMNTNINASANDRRATKPDILVKDYNSFVSLSYHVDVFRKSILENEFTKTT